MSQRTYVSSLPVSITVNSDGTVSVAVDTVDIGEAVYRYEAVSGRRPTEPQHAADIRRAVAAKLASRITVTAMGDADRANY